MCNSWHNLNETKKKISLFNVAGDGSETRDELGFAAAPPLKKTSDWS